MANVDSLDIQISASANSASSALDKLASKLEIMSASLSKINGSGLTGLANGVSKLGSSMQVMNTVKTADFTRLSKNIEKLSAINTQGLYSSASALSQITRALNSVGAVSQSAQQVGELASAIARLGYKSVGNAITNIPLLATALRDLMTTLSTAPQVSASLIQMTNAMANLASQGGKVGNASRSMISGLNGYHTSSNRAKKSTLGLAGAIGKFYATYFLAIRGVRKLSKSVESSMGYVETLNYFERAFDQVASKADLSDFEKLGYDSAETYAKSFSERAKELTSKMTGFEIDESGMAQATGAKSLGLNPTELMDYQAMFGQMASSIGVSAENSLKLSQALTEVGADLASVKNLDFKDVWQDMASGLAGMSRTLDKYGVNIRNVNMQQKLAELGIETNIQKLGQQDKALLRTIILLDSTKYAWADLSETINQPANQLRLLQANIQNLGRTIGGLFLPLVQKILPYINGLTIAIQRLFTWIGNLLGINLSEITSSVGSGSEAISDMLDETEGLADGMDDASKSAKKLKNNLLGIDELNVLSKNEDNGNGVNSIIPTSVLDTAFNDALSEYQAAWDKAFANIENSALNIADSIERVFAPIKEIINDFAIGDFFKAGKDTSHLVASIFNFFADAIDSVDWYGIGQKIGDFLGGLDWVAILKSVGNVVWQALKAALELTMGMFSAAPFETALVSIVALPKLLQAVTSSKIITGFKNLWKQLDKSGDALYFFKAGIQDKNFFTGFRLGLDSIRSGLTKFQKAFIGIGSVALEFSALKDAFYDLSIDSDNLVESIGQIVVVAGVASTALYTAFGVGGLAIAGITAVIGAIAGISKAFEEVRAKEIGEMIGNALSNPNGTPITELADNVKNALSGITEGFADLNTKSNEVEIVNKNIGSVAFEISKIKIAMDEGVLSVEEGNEKLGGLFGQMADLISQKMSLVTSYLMGVYGEGGVLYETYENAEETANNLFDALIRAEFGASDKAKELIEQLGNVEYGSEQWNDLYQQLITLSTGMSEAKEASILFEDAMSNIDIDWDSILLPSGEIDTEKFSTLLQGVTSELDKYKSALDEAETSTRLQLHNAIENAVTPEDKALFESMLNSLTAQFDILRDDGALKIKGFTDMLQSDLVGKTSEIIDSEIANLANKGIDYTDAVGSHSVREALYKYNSGIDVISSEIEAQLTKLGIDGAGWASEASQKIYDELFVPFMTKGDSPFSYIQYMSSDYKSFIDETVGQFTDSGKNAIDGYVKGLSDESLTLEAKWRAKGLGEDTIKELMDSLDEHSPSKETEKIGKYAVEGFNLGFTNNTKLTIETVKKFTTTALENFSNISDSFFEIGVNAMRGFANGISSMASTINESVQGIADNITSTIKSALEIHSPSRVMDKLGKFTMQGFGNGMESMYDGILSSLSHFSSDVSVATVPTYEGFDSYGGYARSNNYFADSDFGNQNTIDNTETNALLRELIGAVRQGKDISLSIDGRELVSAYDDRKTRNGYSFA